MQTQEIQFVRRPEGLPRPGDFALVSATLPEPYLTQMKQHTVAWTFFAAQPPGYQKLMGWWIVSAKREETRQKRLQKLIATSAARQRVI